MKEVSERLAARGHDVRIVATTALSTEDYFLPEKARNLMPEGEETIGGVRVRRVGFTRRGARALTALRKIAWRVPIPGGNRWRALSWGPRSAGYLPAALDGDFDVIAGCPLPTINVGYAVDAARIRKRPLVVVPCFHTEDAYSFDNPLYYAWMRRADAVVTLTDWEKSFLENAAGIPGGKIHTIGAGIDAIDAGPPAVDIRDKYGIGEKKIVLFLGQMGTHKGILTLIEAMEDVLAFRKDTALVVAGNPTAHTAAIESRIRKLDRKCGRKAYLIKGFPETEKRAFFRAADVFVSVSPYESFGIVFLEAWREGLPVIGCRRGGSSKLIDEFKDGLLAEDGNPGELATAILLLLGDEAARRKMGEAGRAKVLERYAWNAVIDSWEHLYHGLSKKG